MQAIAVMELPTLFSDRLKRETRGERAAAESTTYFRLLMAGALEPREYAAFLAQLHAVYTELERAAEALRWHPVVAPFAGTGRSRVLALDDDLRALLGSSWQRRTPITGATRAYCDRIREAAAWPGGFIAHHYVRHLGDLSGGQLIGDTVSKIYGFTGAGASFYLLPAGGDGRRLKQDYRRLLDAAPLGPREQDRIIYEARTALRHNTAVSTAFGQWVARAPVAAVA